MTYNEINGDLFTAPKNSLLVHCISADFALGAGIAKAFADKYNLRNILCQTGMKGDWNGEGYCIITHSHDGDKERWKVANLVTKERCYFKPTYETLKQSLLALCDLCEKYHYFSLAMPLIGCGLDGLEWEKVSALIQEVFKDHKINIMVYRLKESE